PQAEGGDGTARDTQHAAPVERFGGRSATAPRAGTSRTGARERPRRSGERVSDVVCRLRDGATVDRGASAGPSSGAARPGTTRPAVQRPPQPRRPRATRRFPAAGPTAAQSAAACPPPGPASERRRPDIRSTRLTTTPCRPTVTRAASPAELRPVRRSYAD